MMRTTPALPWIMAVVVGLAEVSCATSSKQDDFSVFLQRIAKDCKPLIIGSDDFSQAIIFNGQGAQEENYSNFLFKTRALYSGGISEDIYRQSLTAFIGSGTYNEHSFSCIIGHIPKK
jgi:hypothetical protein